MKKLLVGLLAVASLSTFAGTLNLSPETSISQAIEFGTCSITVKNKPILFLKNNNYAFVGQDQALLFVVRSGLDVSNLRKLAVGRQLLISDLGATEYVLKISDASISSLKVTRGNISFKEMTINQFEELSGGDLIINCTDDVAVEF